MGPMDAIGSAQGRARSGANGMANTRAPSSPVLQPSALSQDDHQHVKKANVLARRMLRFDACRACRNAAETCVPGQDHRARCCAHELRRGHPARRNETVSPATTEESARPYDQILHTSAYLAPGWKALDEVAVEEARGQEHGDHAGVRLLDVGLDAALGREVRDVPPALHGQTAMQSCSSSRFGLASGSARGAGPREHRNSRHRYLCARWDEHFSHETTLPTLSVSAASKMARNVDRPPAVMWPPKR